MSSLNPDNINNVSTIINLDKYNGRVDIIQEPSVDAKFKMQEKIAGRNKATTYHDALTGTWEHNVLSNLFFSAENIQIIQNGLRAGVYKVSNEQYVIPPQNIDNLKIIMRSTYLQYAEHYPDRITEQIERLNQIVLDYCVPNVYNECIAYVKYTQDQSTLVMPFERPLHHDRQYKQLELKPYM
jgi:hypothetical protein